MAKRSGTTGAFVGRTADGGVIRHGDARGLKGTTKVVRTVEAKNEAKAAKARRDLKAAR
jgi:hypothetical protein